MYELNERGIGKKWCDTNGIILLYPTLSQRKLKYLFNANCEFIDYVERDTRSEEAEKISSVPSETKDTNTSVSRKFRGRKANKGKANRTRSED